MRCYFIPWVVVKEAGNITFGGDIFGAHSEDDAVGFIYNKLRKDFPYSRIELGNAQNIDENFIQFWAKEYGII